MTDYRFQFRQDIAEPLRDASFVVETGLYREGRLVAIEAAVTCRHEDGLCDLTMFVTPFSLPADVDADVTDGGRRACELAARGPNQYISAEAARLLEAIDAPRHDPEDLKDIPLSLVKLSDGSELARARTNGRGKAVFERVPIGEICEIRLAGTPAVVAVARPGSAREFGAQNRPGSGLVLAASTAEQVERKWEVVQYTILRRPLVTALLEKENGGALLSAETKDSRLAGYVVHYCFGSEEGDIVLNATHPPGAWGGSRPLGQPFAEAAEREATFEIREPLHEQE
jgi:hypothetical protein